MHPRIRRYRVTKNIGLLAFCLVSLCAGTIRAHHSIVTHYDPNRSMRLTGVVAQYDLRSPHSFLFLDVTGEDSRIERWEVELVSLAHLRRAGIDQETFQRGEEVTIIALPNRQPTNPLVFGVSLVTQEGLLALGSPGNNYVDPAAGAQRLAGRWLTPFPEQAGGTPLPLTEAGQSARERYDPQTSPANNCEPRQMPSIGTPAACARAIASFSALNHGCSSSS